MIDRKSRLVAAVVGGMSLGTAAWALEPADQDARIRDLEAKVQALEAKQASNSKDMAATIESVLRDAENRSQLMANGGTTGAGWDSNTGFYLRAGDAFYMHPILLFQFRNVSNYRDHGNEHSDDYTFDNGFEVTRMKFGFDGWVFTPDLHYTFIWDTDSDDGTVFLEDAFVRYQVADDWGTRIGQFKDPVSHEWLVGDEKQLAVERSLLDAAIGGGLVGRTQGVTLIYGGQAKGKPLNVEVGYTDGMAQANTNFESRTPFTLDEAPATLSEALGHLLEWGIAGRVEYMFMGNDWAEYSDFSARNNTQDLLVVGAGGDFSQGGDVDLIAAAIDAQYENTGGLGVFGSVNYAQVKDDEDDVTVWGFLGQAGYMLNKSWEVFGRYDFVKLDDLVGEDAEDEFHEITVGVNYFMGKDGAWGHRAKISVDLTWLPNGSPAPVTGLGILDDNGERNEFILRAQFQLWL